MKADALILLTFSFLIGCAPAPEAREQQRPDDPVKDSEKNKQQPDHPDESAKIRLAIKELQARIDERKDCLPLHEFINRALPLPDGSRLHTSAEDGSNPFKEFNTPLARKASELRTKGMFGDKPGAKDDVFIKSHLIQLNIENISRAYAQDLSSFYAKLLPDESRRIVGMKDEDRERLLATVRGQDTGLPREGWVIEIRGYTYHHAQIKFVVNTFFENLGHIREGKELIDKTSLMMVYKIEVFENPRPGGFQLIGKSQLEALGLKPAPGQKEPGTAEPPLLPNGRDVAAAHGELRRTEFVILFVWQHPRSRAS